MDEIRVPRKKAKVNTMDEIRVPRKVCIACTNLVEYVLFIVDLDSEKWVDVRLDRNSLYRPAFCFLGSKLYIFQGVETSTPQWEEAAEEEEEDIQVVDPSLIWEKEEEEGEDAIQVVDPSLILEKEEEEGEDEARSVLTYEFSSESVSSLKLDKSMLVKHSVLNEGKLIPTARVTPSGKILVFSEVVFFYSSCGFELYDPADADGKWVKLPRLVPEGVRDDFWIYSFTFMNKSLLILKTECGVFSLDLSSSKEDWKLNGFYGAQYMPSHPGNGFVLIGNYLYLTPFWAYDIDEEIPSRFVFSTRSYSLAPLPHSLASLPHSPFLPIGYNQCPSITLLDDYDLNPGDCRFCIVQTGVDCELVLDVYRCNLTECKKELAKYRKERKEYKEPWLPPPLPGTIKVKTFKIIDSEGAYEFNLNLNSFSAFSLNSKYTSLSI